MNHLSESVLGQKLLPYHHTPTQHNDTEVFGVKYLYKQAGKEFDLATCEDSTQGDDITMDDETDEGFEDSSVALAISISEDMETIGTGEDPTQDDAYKNERPKGKLRR